MRKKNFAFIDIETTGLNVMKHEILEIGCVLATPSLELIEKFDIKIRAENISCADPAALKVIRYSEKDWEGSLPLKEAMDFFSQKVKDCIMVGQNVSFDFQFIEYAFLKAGLSNPMHYHRVDTFSIAWAKLNKNKDVTHLSLRELCKYFDIKNNRPHSALSDAYATFLLYKKLMDI